ncbi:MAG: hypothetical protein ACOCSJ_05505 [Candidatus Natronoplasma sp.]
MRKIKLEDWKKKSSPIEKEKKVKGRPTPKWKLRDSIRYIKRGDDYLREKEILVKKGDRKWKLDVFPSE